MSGMLDRLVAAFVAPVEHEDAGPGRWLEPAPPAAPSIAVLAPPEHALAAGAAVALGLERRRSSSPSGAPPAEAPAAPASPRARRRLATKLAGRGHDAIATGRLVHVRSPRARRSRARRGRRRRPASVLVVAGPRDARSTACCATTTSPRRRSRRRPRRPDDLVAALDGASRRSASPRRRLTLPDAAVARVLAAAGVALVGSVAAGRARGARVRRRRRVGQAGFLLVAVLLAVVVGAFVLGGIARGVGVQAEQQRAADLGALAGAKAMHVVYPRLFERGGMSVAAYRASGVRTAAEVARRNGAGDVDVRLPGRATRSRRCASRCGRGARSRSTATGRPCTRGRRRSSRHPTTSASARAARASTPARSPTGRASRCAPTSRARSTGCTPRPAPTASRCIVTSGFRTNAEQAALFAAHPDPRWVAPPGTSLHRLGTELDLGPPSAYGWLARNAPRFGFKRRYSWESRPFPVKAGSGGDALGGNDGRLGGASSSRRIVGTDGKCSPEVES